MRSHYSYDSEEPVLGPNLHFAGQRGVAQGANCKKRRRGCKEQKLQAPSLWHVVNSAVQRYCRAKSIFADGLAELRVLLGAFWALMGIFDLCLRSKWLCAELFGCLGYCAASKVVFAFLYFCFSMEFVLFLREKMIKKEYFINKYKRRKNLRKTYNYFWMLKKRIYE